MNRIVIVTGGTSGIGKATVELFKKNGDKVYVLARTSEDVENMYVCDVSVEENVKDTIETIGKSEGRIDIIVNSAGYGLSGAVELTPQEEVKKIIDANFFGTLFVNKYALPFMKNGGKIINISSTCALFPLPYRSFYCATKSAVNMLSFGLQMECKQFGVQVCAICPGEVKTNFTKNRIKIFKTNERYENRIENAANYIDSKQDKRMPPEKVANVIFKTCNKSKIKPMIIVGGKYRALYVLSKFLPLSWLLNITEKNFGGHKK